MTAREALVAYAWSTLWRPYLWGGDDPHGWDCSGLVIQLLQGVGAFPRGRDATADGLMRMYAPIAPENVKPGDLVFWLQGERAVHVGILVDPPELYIGAEGGGAWATDPIEALRRNAFIRMAPVDSRGLPAARRFANPFAERT